MISLKKKIILEKTGGVAVDYAEIVCSSCDIIFLCLPTNNLVKSSIQQIIDTGRKGTIMETKGKIHEDCSAIVKHMKKYEGRN